MASAKIKKGDTIVVLAGKDKGRTGEVTRVIPKEGKVVVAGVNVATRHRCFKAFLAALRIGLRRLAMAISNVAVADPKSGKPTRVRFETRDGKKVRIAVKSGELING
jgi:large subunit ribosomal protein L24